MILQLINSSGCLIGTIDEPSMRHAFEKAFAEWAETLDEGDTIKVVKIKDL